MGAHDRAVEHLHQMSRAAQISQKGKIVAEDASLAQP
jgi:hypothetical protein